MSFRPDGRRGCRAASRPAMKARGYWSTVGRRILRDKVSMACALILP